MGETKTAADTSEGREAAESARSHRTNRGPRPEVPGSEWLTNVLYHNPNTGPSGLKLSLSTVTTSPSQTRECSCNSPIVGQLRYLNR